MVHMFAPNCAARDLWGQTIVIILLKQKRRIKYISKHCRQDAETELDLLNDHADNTANKAQANEGIFLLNVVSVSTKKL